MLDTHGGEIQVRMTDLGIGPYVTAERMGFRLLLWNHITHYWSYTCWTDPTDGRKVTCAIPPGVGIKYRWQLTVRNENSPPSPFTTGFFAPVIYFFDDSSPGVVSADTSGSQLVRIRYGVIWRGCQRAC